MAISSPPKPAKSSSPRKSRATKLVRVAHKFGGTSLATAERIAHVAKLLQARPEPEQIVVVSAMSGVTDALIRLTRRAAERSPDWRDDWHTLRQRHRDAARELAIVRQRLPAVPERLSAQVVAFVQRLRRADLFKLPGVAETLDWAEALLTLDREALDAEAVDATLGVLLKYQDDLGKVRGPEARKLLDEVQAAVGGVR